MKSLWFNDKKCTVKKIYTLYKSHKTTSLLSLLKSKILTLIFVLECIWWYWIFCIWRLNNDVLSFLEKCKPGTQSPDGFTSCKLCKEGFYEDRYGSTGCKACPDGMSTLSTGSNSLSDCGGTFLNLFFELSPLISFFLRCNMEKYVVKIHCSQYQS